jgi:FtsP/CotA-like multicopper oxidase with cupredoxin domain
VNITLAPDGYERYTMTFNGTIPGPALIADWGDTFVVHVTNNLENNGTAIHWHGMRQLNNTEFDGVRFISLAPEYILTSTRFLEYHSAHLLLGSL